MYKIGDLIIYGRTGVCEITGFTTFNNINNIDKKQLYYVLKPLYHNETIYAPTDSTKVFMRPIITKQEAEQLIDLIPTIQAEAYYNNSMQQLVAHHEELLNTHDCADLIGFVMSVNSKKQCLEQQHRKFGQIDDRFMKIAEDLLYSEFSAALNIPKEKVPEYISSRVEVLSEKHMNESK